MPLWSAYKELSNDVLKMVFNVSPNFVKNCSRPKAIIHGFSRFWVKIQPTAKRISLECPIHADRNGANPSFISPSMPTIPSILVCYSCTPIASFPGLVVCHLVLITYSIFAYCKPSKPGGLEGLGTRPQDALHNKWQCTCSKQDKTRSLLASLCILGVMSLTRSAG